MRHPVKFPFQKFEGKMELLKILKVQALTSEVRDLRVCMIDITLSLSLSLSH